MISCLPEIAVPQPRFTLILSTQCVAYVNSPLQHECIHHTFQPPFQGAFKDQYLSAVLPMEQ